MAALKGEERAAHLAREAVELVDAGHREVRDAMSPSKTSMQMATNGETDMITLILGRIPQPSRGPLNRPR